VPIDHEDYFSSLVLRKWDKLRSVYIEGDVVGYSHESLGDALVSGNLRHLVTLVLRPDQYFDPSFLDCDVYKWCTPLLEKLSVKLGKPKAVKQRKLEERKFFVHLPKLRRLCVRFEAKYCCEAIIGGIPQSVTDLKMFSIQQMGGLPFVPQPGLRRLSLDEVYSNRVISCNLNLQCRHVVVCIIDMHSATYIQGGQIWPSPDES
jgi:hypothetical protein